MNVTVIGGGNIGTGMAAYLAQNGNNVTIYASGYSKFGNDIEVIDSVTNESFKVYINGATYDLEKALENAELVYVTYPSFMIENLFDRMSDILKNPIMIGVIPGTGGVEFVGKRLSEDGHTLFGFDRVPCIARIGEYGRSVFASKKELIRCAAFLRSETKRVCNINENILGIKCLPLKNYLTVTFTPSNPILHTARTFSMFKNYRDGVVYDRDFLFYHEWEDEASDILIKLDNELRQICVSLKKIDLSDMVFIKDHYESYSVKELTKKLSSIESLKKITSPMKQYERGYIPDFTSRYFVEDVPYGLFILKGFALIADVDTPFMDKVILWNQEMLGKEYINKSGTLGKDAFETAVPQKYGLSTKKDIYDYYL